MGEFFAKTIWGMMSWVSSIAVDIMVAVLSMVFDTIDAVFHAGGVYGPAISLGSFFDAVLGAMPGGLKVVDFFVYLDTIRVGVGLYITWLMLCLGVRFLIWLYLKFWGANI